MSFDMFTITALLVLCTSYSMLPRISHNPLGLVCKPHWVAWHVLDVAKASCVLVVMGLFNAALQSLNADVDDKDRDTVFCSILPYMACEFLNYLAVNKTVIYIQLFHRLVINFICIKHRNKGIYRRLVEDIYWSSNDLQLKLHSCVQSRNNSLTHAVDVFGFHEKHVSVKLKALSFK